MTGAAVGRRSARRGWLMWIGALIGLGALAWVLRRFEFDRFLALVRDADVRFLTLIALAIMAEQLVRAWKWRQLLHPLRPGMGVLRLFGAIMAGYLLAIMFPFGLGTVARSWLVARREDLRFASVLVTVAIDRLTDGLICACLVPIALVLVAFPDPSGGVRAGLVWGGALSFALVLALAFVLVLYRRDVLLPRDASCASRTVCRRAGEQPCGRRQPRLPTASYGRARPGAGRASCLRALS